MSKLTFEDIRTVETFLASPEACIAAGLQAQCYEPRGAGYQPSTDMKLARLVLHGVRTGKSAWSIASCVIDQLCGRPGGGRHLDVIQRYGTTQNRASVGALAEAAIVRGREVARTRAWEAMEASRASALKSEYEACIRANLTAYQTTAQVLALDARLPRRPAEVTRAGELDGAYEAVRKGLVNVDREIDAMLDAAAEAMSDARARVVASERALVAAKKERRASFRTSLSARPIRENVASKVDARRAAAALTQCLQLCAEIDEIRAAS